MPILHPALLAPVAYRRRGAIMVARAASKTVAAYHRPSARHAYITLRTQAGTHPATRAGVLDIKPPVSLSRQREHAHPPSGHPTKQRRGFHIVPAGGNIVSDHGQMFPDTFFAYPFDLFPDIKHREIIVDHKDAPNIVP